MNISDIKFIVGFALLFAFVISFQEFNYNSKLHKSIFAINERESLKDFEINAEFRKHKTKYTTNRGGMISTIKSYEFYIRELGLFQTRIKNCYSKQNMIKILNEERDHMKLIFNYNIFYILDARLFASDLEELKTNSNFNFFKKKYLLKIQQIKTDLVNSIPSKFYVGCYYTFPKLAILFDKVNTGTAEIYLFEEITPYFDFDAEVFIDGKILHPKDGQYIFLPDSLKQGLNSFQIQIKDGEKVSEQTIYLEAK